MNEKVSTLLLWIRSRPAWFWLAVILIFSFLLKLLCWFLEPVVSSDGAYYIRLAQIWYETGDFQSIQKLPNAYPPLLNYMVQLLMHLGLSAEAAGVGINLVLGTFTPLLTYGIAYEVTQKKNIAICSALMIAVNPYMNELSTEVQRDMIYLFFIGLALWSFFVGIRRKNWLFILGTSIVTGASILVRYETLELFVILPISFIILFIIKYLSFKKCLLYFVVFCIGTIATVYSLASLMRVWDYSYFKNNYMNTTMSVVKYFYKGKSGK